MKPGLRRLGEALGADHLWVVGGALRDELLGRPHGDWDLATDLLPEQAMERGRRSGLKVLPTGLQHGTVTVLAEGEGFEVTTFRSDGTYSDGRHPDGVQLGVTLEEDLSRRDFTINALALPLPAVGSSGWREAVVDPHGGRVDLAAGLIRAVGDPRARFQEDGLRALRACRFAAQLGFALHPDTEAAIPERLAVAAKVAMERVFTELTKLLGGPEASRGLRLLEGTGLLDLWLPEMRPMVGCGQNRHHRYDVWDHTLRALDFAPGGDPALRWALFLHDVGKPSARGLGPIGEVHFHGHEERSVALASALLRRLKASNQLIQAVEALIRHHGIHPEPGWSDAACRRFLRRLAEDGLPLEAWHAFRLADQKAKGWGDAPVRPGDPEPEVWHAGVEAACDATRERLAALLAARPPLQARDLALDGKALMALAGRKGGPWLGELQRHLLEAVLEAPDLNHPEALTRVAHAWLEPEDRI